MFGKTGPLLVALLVVIVLFLCYLTWPEKVEHLHSAGPAGILESPLLLNSDPPVCDEDLSVAHTCRRGVTDLYAQEVNGGGYLGRGTDVYHASVSGCKSGCGSGCGSGCRCRGKIDDRDLLIASVEKELIYGGGEESVTSGGQILVNGQKVRPVKTVVGATGVIGVSEGFTNNLAENESGVKISVVKMLRDNKVGECANNSCGPALQSELGTRNNYPRYDPASNVSVLNLLYAETMGLHNYPPSEDNCEYNVNGVTVQEPCIYGLGSAKIY